MVSRLDRIYSNIATAEPSERYWSVAVLGSLRDDARPSDRLPLVLRISLRRARTARLPRISAELLATDAEVGGWSIAKTWESGTRR